MTTIELKKAETMTLIAQAVELHARGKIRLFSGDMIGGAEITSVGTHTVGFVIDGWRGAVQIPFIDGMGNLLPSWYEAERELQRERAALDQQDLFDGFEGWGVGL